MFVKIVCQNSDGICNKTLIKIYKDNKLIVEKDIFNNDYIYLPKNEAYMLIANNYVSTIKTSFITNYYLHNINLIFNNNISLITINVKDRYYPKTIIEKGVISLWPNMM